MRARSRTAAALVLSGLLGLGLLTLDPARAEDHPVHIKGLAFNPEEITIRAGESVTWSNEDTDHHHLVGGPISSPELAKGEHYTLQFNEPSEVSYKCTIHTYMEGKVIVQTPDGKAPPSTQGEPQAPPAPSTTTSSTRPPGPTDGVPAPKPK
jgi:plastocyanin